MSKGCILVTGGAGYIGSHAVLTLREAGESLVVLDDLSTGSRESIAPDVPFVEGDVADGDLVRRVIAKIAFSTQQIGQTKKREIQELAAGFAYC